MNRVQINSLLAIMLCLRACGCVCSQGYDKTSFPSFSYLSIFCHFSDGVDIIRRKHIFHVSPTFIHTCMVWWAESDISYLQKIMYTKSFSHMIKKLQTSFIRNRQWEERKTIIHQSKQGLGKERERCWLPLLLLVGRMLISVVILSDASFIEFRPIDLIYNRVTYALINNFKTECAVTWWRRQMSER